MGSPSCCSWVESGVGSHVLRKQQQAITNTQQEQEAPNRQAKVQSSSTTVQIGPKLGWMVHLCKAIKPTKSGLQNPWTLWSVAP